MPLRATARVNKCTINKRVKRVEVSTKHNEAVTAARHCHVNVSDNSSRRLESGTSWWIWRCQAVECQALRDWASDRQTVQFPRCGTGVERT